MYTEPTKTYILFFVILLLGVAAFFLTFGVAWFASSAVIITWMLLICGIASIVSGFISATQPSSSLFWGIGFALPMFAWGVLMALQVFAQPNLLLWTAFGTVTLTSALLGAVIGRKRSRRRISQHQQNSKALNTPPSSSGPENY